MPVPSTFKPTQLREYSAALKMLKEQEITALAELHAVDPARLIGRIRHSLATVDDYPAIDEPLRDKPPKALPVPSDEVTSGTGFAAHVFTKAKWVVGGDKRLGFRVVDREVSTLRSKDTPPEDRARRRALDLLLANAQDDTLIVGELKVAGDVTAYHALVQALMYAVELASASQLARAANHLAGRVRTGPAPAIDIYLIGFAPPARAQYRGRIHEATRTIAQRVLEDRGVADRIRRIAYLDAAIVDGKLAFDARYAFGADLCSDGADARETPANIAR